ncbi:helix-turn-helix domain-containing protein [Kitasatospora sp. NBC_00374]|uniref:helix-turn-helix domain-containing protein n=1 Tax=Kitasatospora sp. NBC_00374 TaxID=2975964 RepID=UPI003244F521
MAALFGARVRRLRLAAGLTQAELGERTFTHSTRINQIERTTGHRPTLDLARALDTALGADGLFTDLWQHVNRESFPDWSRAFMDREARATEIRTYMAQTVHGLLQTGAYARAILSIGKSLKTEEQLAERLNARMSRQDRLRGPGAPELWVVLDEAVLMRPVGGGEVMREQLAHLLDVARSPLVTLQVLPFDQGEHRAMGGSLTVLVLPDGAEVAYTEGADYGRLIEDPAEVEPYSVTYDRLRAHALPPSLSLSMIRSVMEGTYSASRSARRRLAQVQLQQSGGRRVRRGGRRLSGGGARA